MARLPRGHHRSPTPGAPLVRARVARIAPALATLGLPLRGTMAWTSAFVALWPEGVPSVALWPERALWCPRGASSSLPSLGQPTPHLAFPRPDMPHGDTDTPAIPLPGRVMPFIPVIPSPRRAIALFLVQITL